MSTFQEQALLKLAIMKLAMLEAENAQWLAMAQRADCDSPGSVANEIDGARYEIAAQAARIALLEEALKRAALHGFAHPKERWIWAPREAIALLDWVEGGMVGPLPEIKDPIVLDAIAERGGL